jgi:hypothetical protein
MQASGMEVPAWMLQLKKEPTTLKQKLVQKKNVPSGVHRKRRRLNAAAKAANV